MQQKVEKQLIVVLLTDITARVYKNYQRSPDDENRVFYVGITRTKENLYLIEPKTTRFVKYKVLYFAYKSKG